MARRIPQPKRGGIGSRRDEQIRHEIAQEAARILATEQSLNYYNAKQKAAARLGVRDVHCLPRNDEVETALRSYQALFQGGTQPQDLLRLRQIAFEAMTFFQRFAPRLVGSVLNGTATRGATVCLHLFSDNVEDVLMVLMDSGIPYHLASNRLVINNSRSVTFPVCCFVVDEVPVEATVFPEDHLREAPRTVVDGELIERATKSAVALLVQSTR